MNRRKEALEGSLFIAPFLLFAAVFMLFPMFKGIINSFYDFKFGGHIFVGLQNYLDIFKDKVYLQSMKNTLLFVFAVVPLLIVVGILVAGSVFDKCQAYMSFVRVSLYVPVVASMVVMAIIWRFLLDSQSGLLRYFYMVFDIAPVNLLGDANWTRILLIIILFTMNIGQSIILYLAVMIGIPSDLTDALKIDGGARLDLFRHILIPISAPITLFIFITQTAAVLRVFVVIQLLTNGGPNYGSTTMMYQLYQQGFRYGNFGTASALGVVMFIFTLALALVQFKTIKVKR